MRLSISVTIIDIRHRETCSNGFSRKIDKWNHRRNHHRDAGFVVFRCDFRQSPAWRLPLSIFISISVAISVVKIDIVEQCLYSSSADCDVIMKSHELRWRNILPMKTDVVNSKSNVPINAHPSAYLINLFIQGRCLTVTISAASVLKCWSASTSRLDAI